MINIQCLTNDVLYLSLLGPFTSLNAEEIENEVGDMWRTMYKLTKSFGDQPGPRRIADSVKGKIDKFKQHLPILHTICNPGIRDRHWEAVSTSLCCTQRNVLVCVCVCAQTVCLIIYNITQYSNRTNKLIYKLYIRKWLQNRKRFNSCLYIYVVVSVSDI